MKLFIFIFVVFSTPCIFGQPRVFYNFSDASKIADSVQILRIDCSHGNRSAVDCDSIPKDLDRFKNLTQLSITETGIRVLPENINKLHRLKYLDISTNYYLDYEKELCKIVGSDSLEQLRLGRSNIKILPKCIEQLKTLRRLDVSHNYQLDIESTFSILKNLPLLESLSMGGVRTLKVIPKDIIELKKLNFISLSYFDKDFDFKSTFSRLSNLSITSIDLSNNGLKSLPDEIEDLQFLEKIDLNENYFDSIPNQLFQLPNLKEISFQANNDCLKFINNQISKLKKLEKITLGNNGKLEGQTAIINLSKLTNLKFLDFFSCGIENIPDEIRNYKALERLNLSRNSKIDFSDLFNKLSSVKTLKYLDISDNKISSLPKEIGLLTSLEYLCIGRNPIITIPDEIVKLKNLKVVNVNRGKYKVSESGINKIKELLPNCQIVTDWIYRD